jgi:hypothetical protein
MSAEPESPRPEAATPESPRPEGVEPNEFGFAGDLTGAISAAVEDATQRDD